MSPPEGEENGVPAGNEGSAGAGAGDAGAAAAASAAAGTEGGKPAEKAASAGDEVKVPDKFLVDGKPDYTKLTKSYLELEKSQFRRREEVRKEALAEAETARRANVPAAPGDYEIKSEFKVGERDIVLKTDDPMLDWMRGVAHKYGIPKGDLDEVIQGYVGQMISAQPSWSKEAEELGGNADARHSRVDGWLKGNLSKENYSTFAGMPATAKMIMAIEEMMTVAGSPPVSEMGATLPGERYTREELTVMMRDPKYTGVGGKIDQGYVNKVRAGFQRLNRN